MMITRRCVIRCGVCHIIPLYSVSKITGLCCWRDAQLSMAAVLVVVVESVVLVVVVESVVLVVVVESVVLVVVVD